MVFAWPNAEIGMMDAKSAAKIMYEGSDAATINEKAAEYATLQNNVTSAAMWTPSSSRKTPENMLSAHSRCCIPREKTDRTENTEQSKEGGIR